MTILYFWLFIGFLVLGLPIAFALIIGPVLALLATGNDSMMIAIPQRLFVGVNQFSLLAIPLFLLAGEIMNAGTITRRILDFADALVGHLVGGLAQVNNLSSVFMSGISGSATADASALGSVLVPAMEKQGYPRGFAAAVTAASAVIGPIIPPSVIMIIYAYAVNLPVAALFLGGVLPGLLLCAGLMAITHVLSRRRNYPRRERMMPFSEILQVTRRAFLPLLTPVLMLGGILSGVFTPTEAAGATVFYALFLSLFVLRSMSLRDLGGVLARSAVSSAVILLLIGGASVFGWLATLSGFSVFAAEVMTAITSNPLVMLLLINILLLVVGMFLDAAPAVLILAPILAPMTAQLGIDPLHLAILMCVNLTLGLATPPVGMILFVTSAVGRVKVSAIVREMGPFYLVHLAVLLAITFIPPLTLWLPGQFGF